ncbi:unnamed protein product, partial [Discosporangium mesarthrocarpum]
GGGGVRATVATTSAQGLKMPAQSIGQVQQRGKGPAAWQGQGHGKGKRVVQELRQVQGLRGKPPPPTKAHGAAPPVDTPPVEKTHSGGREPLQIGGAEGQRCSDGRGDHSEDVWRMGGYRKAAQDERVDRICEPEMEGLGLEKGLGQGVIEGHQGGEMARGNGVSDVLFQTLMESSSSSGSSSSRSGGGDSGVGNNSGSGGYGRRSDGSSDGSSHTGHTLLIKPPPAPLWRAPWREWDEAAGKNRANALRIGIGDLFFTALVDTLNLSIPETWRQGQGQGKGQGLEEELGNEMDLTHARLALQTAMKVASGAHQTLQIKAQELKAGTGGMAVSCRARSHKSPAGAGDAGEEEVLLASVVSNRFLHILLQVVGVCDRCTEHLQATGSRARTGQHQNFRGGKNDKSSSVVWALLVEAVRLLSIMTSFPWWAEEGQISEMGYTSAMIPSLGWGAGWGAGGSRRSGMGVSERWTTLSTLVSLLRLDLDLLTPAGQFLEQHVQQVLVVQQESLSCLGTVIASAGVETLEMLLAHHAPAALCACLVNGPFTPSGVGGGGSRITRVRNAPLGWGRRFSLAVHALACLVHPSGTQWAPVCVMPFMEVTVAVAAGQSNVGQRAGAEAGTTGTGDGAILGGQVEGGRQILEGAPGQGAQAKELQSLVELGNKGKGGREVDNTLSQGLALLLLETLLREGSMPEDIALDCVQSATLCLSKAPHGQVSAAGICVLDAALYYTHNTRPCHQPDGMTEEGMVREGEIVAQWAPGVKEIGSGAVASAALKAAVSPWVLAVVRKMLTFGSVAHASREGLQQEYTCKIYQSHGSVSTAGCHISAGPCLEGCLFGAPLRGMLDSTCGLLARAMAAPGASVGSVAQKVIQAQLWAPLCKLLQRGGSGELSPAGLIWALEFAAALLVGAGSSSSSSPVTQGRHEDGATGKGERESVPGEPQLRQDLVEAILNVVLSPLHQEAVLEWPTPSVRGWDLRSGIDGNSGHGEPAKVKRGWDEEGSGGGEPGVEAVVRAALAVLRAPLSTHLPRGLLVPMQQVIHTTELVRSLVKGITLECSGVRAAPGPREVPLGRVVALQERVDLLSRLVLLSPELSSQFATAGGVSMLATSGALEVGGSPLLLTGALVIVSQLARASKENYPTIHTAGLHGQIRCLLGHADASVRAKACNLVGNLCRHSSFFYGTLEAHQPTEPAAFSHPNEQSVGPFDGKCREKRNFNARLEAGAG